MSVECGLGSLDPGLGVWSFRLVEGLGSGFRVLSFRQWSKNWAQAGLYLVIVVGRPKRELHREQSKAGPLRTLRAAICCLGIRV